MSRRFRAFRMPDSSELLAVLAGLAACALGAELRGQCQYEITATIQGPECGIFGFPPTFGTALSDSGEVVGWYTACTIGTDEAFYWSAETGFVTLDRPPGVYAARAGGLAYDGTIVGTYSVTDIGLRAFRYEDGEWLELPPVNPQSGWSQGISIRPDGMIVVGDRSITDDPSPYNACIWDAKGEAIDLGIMQGPFSRAMDVTQSGIIVGWTGNHTQSVSDGFVLVENKLAFLGPVPGGTTSTPNGVTESGVVYGSGRVPVEGSPNGVTRAFIWNAGDFQMLGTLQGFLRSAAGDGTDDPIRVVGASTTFEGNPNVSRGFLWQDGVMTDLNALIPAESGQLITSASAIRSDGVILASAKNLDGDIVAIVLTPKPSPSGDFNADCTVDARDLTALLESWGACELCAADLNDDGAVGPTDLAMLLANWG